MRGAQFPATLTQTFLGLVLQSAAAPGRCAGKGARTSAGARCCHTILSSACAGCRSGRAQGAAWEKL